MHIEKGDSRSSGFLFLFPNIDILDKSLLINLTYLVAVAHLNLHHEKLPLCKTQKVPPCTFEDTHKP